MQFSLRAMFIATAYVAAAARCFVSAHDPQMQLIALFSVPILLGCAVATLAGRRWIKVGIAIDVALLGMILINLLIVA